MNFIYRLFGGQARDVFRGMATLAFGAVAAKLIGAACIPIITRLYSADYFGVLGVFTSFLIILTPVSTLRYNLALPLPRVERVSAALIVLSLVSLVSFVFLLAMILFFFRDLIFSIFQIESLGPFWWILPFGLFSYGLYDLLNMLAIRDKNYRDIGKSTAFQSFGDSLVKISGGVFYQTHGLLFGQAAGPLLGSFYLWVRLRKSISWAFFNVRWRDFVFAALRYKYFPLYRLPSQMLLVFSMQAPLLFFAKYYGIEESGQLGLALMAISLPMNILGNSMSNAYYGEISSLGIRQTSKIISITYSVISRLAALSLLPAAFLMFFGEPFFELAFGEAWRRAGAFSSMLSIYLFAQFIQAPVAKILFVYDGHKLLFYINLQRVVLVFSVFLATWYFSMSASVSLLSYSVVLSVHYLASMFVSIKFARDVGSSLGLTDRSSA